MNNSVQALPLANLALAFIPVFLVIWIIHKWSLNHREALYAFSRMLAQLMLIGYFLAYLFESDNAWLIMTILAVMLFLSSWIALMSVKSNRRELYGKALLAIALGGGSVLALVTAGVLALDPWHLPRYLIPLAGMIFSTAMNSVSLAADRMKAEIQRDADYKTARAIAFRASLIPITNSLFAVGLVAIPGMMTGQILSGISPLVAARYQIMVMCMVYGASGMASAFFLLLIKKSACDIFNKPETSKK